MRSESTCQDDRFQPGFIGKESWSSDIKDGTTTLWRRYGQWRLDSLPTDNNSKRHFSDRQNYNNSIPTQVLERGTAESGFWYCYLKFGTVLVHLLFFKLRLQLSHVWGNQLKSASHTCSQFILYNKGKKLLERETVAPEWFWLCFLSLLNYFRLEWICW